MRNLKYQMRKNKKYTLPTRSFIRIAYHKKLQKFFIIRALSISNSRDYFPLVKKLQTNQSWTQVSHEKIGVRVHPHMISNF